MIQFHVNQQLQIKTDMTEYTENAFFTTHVNCLTTGFRKGIISNNLLFKKPQIDLNSTFSYMHYIDKNKLRTIIEVFTLHVSY